VLLAKGDVLGAGLELLDATPAGFVAHHVVSAVAAPYFAAKEAVENIKQQEDEAYAAFERVWGGGTPSEPAPAQPAQTVIASTPAPAPTRTPLDLIQGMMLFEAAIALIALASSKQANAPASPAGEGGTDAVTGASASVSMGQSDPFCQFWTPTGIPFGNFAPAPCF
jgi:hypothetical protein